MVSFVETSFYERQTKSFKTGCPGISPLSSTYISVVVYDIDSRWNMMVGITVYKRCVSFMIIDDTNL